MATLPPHHIGRAAEDIVSEKVYFDSAGYFYRAMSWLSRSKESHSYAELVYACIDARLGIEYLLFEELVISTGANLSIEDYERCVKDGNLDKAIRRINPDYRKLQEFTSAIVALETTAPNLNYWDPKELMKSWGILSEALHWKGAISYTTDDVAWVDSVINRMEETINPIWERITSGQSGIMHPKDMHPEIREIWERFKSEDINLENVKFQLNIMRPMLSAKYT